MNNTDTDIIIYKFNNYINNIISYNILTILHKNKGKSFFNNFNYTNKHIKLFLYTNNGLNQKSLTYVKLISNNNYILNFQKNCNNNFFFHINKKLKNKNIEYNIDYCCFYKYFDFYKSYYIYNKNIFIRDYYKKNLKYIFFKDININCYIRFKNIYYKFYNNYIYYNMTRHCYHDNYKNLIIIKNYKLLNLIIFVFKIFN